MPQHKGYKMSPEHQQKMWEARDRAHAKAKEEREYMSGCGGCKVIEWYGKQMGIEVDRDNCPIKCRLNKEVKENANNE